MAINPNDPEVQPKDSYELMIERAKEKLFVFPYLIDEGQKVYPVFGATKTPHVYVLDHNRVVRYIGAIDDNAQDASSVTEKYLEKAISSLDTVSYTHLYPGYWCGGKCPNHFHRKI